MPPAVCRALIAALCLPLAAFFGFVGWYKAFATLADLAAHNAFTIHLPVLLGKALGWFEMAGALVLVLGSIFGRLRRTQISFALALAAEQIVSSLIHWRHGELGMIGQNSLLIAALLAIALLGRRLLSLPAGA
ncbi:hypothetical protein [Novosphingobium sp. B 225]|uniref:hypothetical protein n=1 Tax=Novosphingobium sp. B 225 TaxID=1961849 RepID=UPI0011250BFA|nr:hypothetical protein [Novosphingobium sp. B 225]